jgi:hypothetical protein
LRANTVPISYLQSRKTFGSSSHFKADVKRLQKTKFDFVEQGICTGAFCITALVAGSGKAFADLTALVAALPAYKYLIPLQFTKVFLQSSSVLKR